MSIAFSCNLAVKQTLQITTWLIVYGNGLKVMQVPRVTLLFPPYCTLDTSACLTVVCEIFPCQHSRNPPSPSFGNVSRRDVPRPVLFSDQPVLDTIQIQSGLKRQ